ncbi:hypothetical protein CCACVL1_04263 [Corchorus capsularis]|uniref:Uncharacterized protein n=1 Tax=Corchorus capsularis TaxID=210143 RepID=A0A1R3JTW4_COCAP|nr:hypothetical protein CCACVL1_04263 [Corchorus capsularis]
MERKLEKEKDKQSEHGHSWDVSCAWNMKT